MERNPAVTDPEPFGPNGDRNGPSEPPAGDGEPNAATTPRYCRKCAAEVVPEGKGKCPRCGSFLRLNFVARRHKVNVLRRDALLAELQSEFRPATIIERATCEHLAATLEQLETMRPGSTEWQRLVTTAQTLGAALHDAHPESRTPTNYADLTEDQLVARLETLLDSARAIRDSKRGSVQTAAMGTEGTAIASEPSDTEYREQETIHETAIDEPAPEPTCGYGCGSLARCAEIKATRSEAWRALHFLDPQEAARRTQEANEDAVDQVIAREQQWPTARMRAQAEAEQPAQTEEQRRQAALRSKLGWDARTLKT